MTRRLFVSYTRTDKAEVDELVGDLGNFGHDVWLDHRLVGGQDWWDEILDRIQACDVFVVAVSSESLDSVACNRELAYARVLHRPVLPVQIRDLPSERLMAPDLAQLQRVRYEVGSKRSSLELLGALERLPTAPPLVEPLPARPAVPLSYLARLREELEAEHLDLDRQLALVARLDAEGRDDDQRADVVELARRFRRRRDIYSLTANQIDQLLAALRSADEGSEPSDNVHHRTERGTRGSARAEATKASSDGHKRDRSSNSSAEPTTTATSTGSAGPRAPFSRFFVVHGRLLGPVLLTVAGLAAVAVLAPAAGDRSLLDFVGYSARSRSFHDGLIATVYVVSVASLLVVAVYALLRPFSATSRALAVGSTASWLGMVGLPLLLFAVDGLSTPNIVWLAAVAMAVSISALVLASNVTCISDPGGTTTDRAARQLGGLAFLALIAILLSEVFGSSQSQYPIRTAWTATLAIPSVVLVGACLPFLTVLVLLRRRTDRGTLAAVAIIGAICGLTYAIGGLIALRALPRLAVHHFAIAAVALTLAVIALSYRRSLGAAASVDRV